MADRDSSTTRLARQARVRLLVAAEPAAAPPAAADDLSRLCRAAVRALPASGVGLSVIAAPGADSMIAASDPRSARAEELQFTAGEGPCMDAIASGRPVLNDDLRSAMSRWPAYAPSAYDRGVRAVFAFPLQVSTIRLGAMDVYRAEPGPLSAQVAEDASVFAEVALLMILEAQAQAGDGQPASVLEAGLLERSELYQAQGMLKVQLGIDLAEAMLRLRAYAYAHDQPLAEVARAVLERRLQLGDPA